MQTIVLNLYFILNEYPCLYLKNPLNLLNYNKLLRQTKLFVSCYLSGKYIYLRYICEHSYYFIFFFRLDYFFTCMNMLLSCLSGKPMLPTCLIIVWIMLNWFYFRPKQIRKQQQQLDDIIDRLQHICDQKNRS